MHNIYPAFGNFQAVRSIWRMNQAPFLPINATGENMFKNFFPRSAPYFTYFEQQNGILQQISSLLANELARDSQPGNYQKELSSLEAQADEMHYAIIRELSRTFITPIDREDIYAISTAQERTIDSMTTLGIRFYLLSFAHARFPAKKCFEDMRSMSRVTGELLECLKGKQQPSATVSKMHKLKDNCEMLLGVGVAELHDVEITTFDQVKKLVAWAQLYDRIDQTIVLFSELTDTMEQAVLKYA